MLTCIILCSAPFYNLSLMTSDFFSLLFGLFLFHYKPYYLYFIAYPLVVTGLVGLVASNTRLQAHADYHNSLFRSCTQ
jgi:hypothetical protein